MKTRSAFSDFPPCLKYIIFCPTPSESDVFDGTFPLKIEGIVYKRSCNCWFQQNSDICRIVPKARLSMDAILYTYKCDTYAQLIPSSQPSRIIIGFPVSWSILRRYAKRKARSSPSSFLLESSKLSGFRERRMLRKQPDRCFRKLRNVMPFGTAILLN